ncbi:MAG: hypothetical protein A2882_10860 [Phenylobacterium sp. RIFCSPHIGHO2_01_FULL_70_10]|nr:MAG: hypothetical protein A2882_10860 [Phenylobacterium sp. RIFCSPHIGHO2_01_FULL_70_10]
MARRIPRLETIEAFIEAARAPNFRIAAERCAISPAAFSRRIQAFAAFAGCDLFERTAQGMRLTDSGRACLAALEPTYLEMRRAALEIGLAARPAKVSISLSHSLAVGWLIPRLDRLCARHPQIDVVIRTDRTAAAVRAGDADLGVCAQDVDVSDLVAEHFLDMHIFPVACPAVGETFRAGAGLERLRLLAVIQHPDVWEWWSREVGQPMPGLRAAQTFDILQAMYEASAAGHGVSAASHVTVQPHLASGRLVELGLPAARYPGCYRLAATARRLQSPPVRAVWTWMREEAAADPAPSPELRSAA